MQTHIVNVVNCSIVCPNYFSLHIELCVCKVEIVLTAATDEEFDGGFIDNAWYQIIFHPYAGFNTSLLRRNGEYVQFGFRALA